MFIAIFATFTLAACGDKEEDKSKEESKENDQEEAEEELPEPDLEDIPDVVAEVDGEEILKDEFVNMYQSIFQQEIMQAQMSGQSAADIDQDLLRDQTIGRVIDSNLIINEAKATIKDVSEDDINKMIDGLLEQTGLETKEELLETFKEQGTDEEEFMSQVEVQVKVDQLVDGISEDVELTEEETKEAYETLKAQQEQVDSEEELPSFDEIKSSLEEQLKDQKAGVEIEAFIESLREKADITKHI